VAAAPVPVDSARLIARYTVERATPNRSASSVLGVFAGLPQVDEVGFLGGLELWLLAAQPALGPGHFHALLRSKAAEVGLKFGDHGQDVEQQPADGSVGSCTDRRC